MSFVCRDASEFSTAIDAGRFRVAIEGDSRSRDHVGDARFDREGDGLGLGSCWSRIEQCYGHEYGEGCIDRSHGYHLVGKEKGERRRLHVAEEDDAGICRADPGDIERTDLRRQIADGVVVGVAGAGTEADPVDLGVGEEVAHGVRDRERVAVEGRAVRDRVAATDIQVGVGI